MRAAALYSAAGSLLLSALTAAPGRRGPDAAARPSSTAPPWPPRARSAAGIDVRRVPRRAGPAGQHAVRHRDRPAGLRPPGRQADRARRQPGAGPRRRTRTTASARSPGRAPWSTTPAGRAPPACTSRWSALLPEWKRIASRLRPRRLRPARRRAVPRRCPARTPSEFFKGPAQAPTHPSEAYKRERIAQAKAYARGCAEQAGQRAAALPLAQQRPRPGRAARRARRVAADVHGRVVRHLLRRAVRDAVPRARTADGVRLGGRSRTRRRSGTATTSPSRRRSRAAGRTSGRGSPGTTARVRARARPRGRYCAATSGRGRGWPPSRPAGRSGRGSCRRRSCRPGTTTTTGRTARDALSAYLKGDPEAAGRAGGAGIRKRPPRRRTPARCTRPSSATTRPGRRTGRCGTGTTPGSRAWRPSRPGTTCGRTCRAPTGRRPGSGRSMCAPGRVSCRRR